MRILFNNALVTILIITSFYFISMNDAVALETAVFKGRVFDPNGKAVKGAEVFIYNSLDTRRPADFISASTDEYGNFIILLPAGEYWAVARLRKGEKYGPLMAGDKHSGEPVDIKLSVNEEVGMDFIVADIRDASRISRKTREGHFKVSGRILHKGEKTGKQLFVVANRGNQHPDIPDFMSAWADDEGSYSIYLPKGNYFIGHADNFTLQGYNIYNKVTVESDMDNIDIEIESIPQR